MCFDICQYRQKFKATLKWFSKLSVNIQRLFSNIYQIRYYDYDIICLWEKWLTAGHTDRMINIQGYDHIRLDRSSDNIMSNNNHPKRGGGLIIYYKRELSPYITGGLISGIHSSVLMKSGISCVI